METSVCTRLAVGETHHSRAASTPRVWGPRLGQRYETQGPAVGHGGPRCERKESPRVDDVPPARLRSFYTANEEDMKEQGVSGEDEEEEEEEEGDHKVEKWSEWVQQG
ncbi:unnamed protein product [Gadus morhua 'NCC']